MHFRRKMLALAILATASLVGISTPAAADREGGRIELAPLQQVVDTRMGPPTTMVSVPDGLVTVTVLPTTAGAGWVTVRPCGAAPSATDRRVPYEDDFTSIQVVAEANTCAHATTSAHFIVIREAGLRSSPDPAAAQYVPVSPVALMSGRAQLDFFESASLGRPTLPPGATAAVVTVELGRGYGNVDLARCGSVPLALPHSAMEAFVAVVPLGPADSLCLWGGAFGSDVELQVELIGYLSPNGPNPNSVPPMFAASEVPILEPGFAPINPDRALDTRNGIGCLVYEGECYVPEKVWAGETIALDVSNYLSPWTTALSLNVTTAESDEPGFLTVWPCDEPMPDTSNLNWEQGETRANLAVTKISADATVCVMTTAMTHLIVDVTGAYDFALGVPAQPVPPDRLLDTRNAIGVAERARVSAGQVLTLQVTGRGGVPGDADAVTFNMTAVEPLGDGFVTVWPCDQPMPNASNVNYTTGRNVPNLVTVGLSAQGTVCFYTYAATHLLADVAAWYGDGGSAGLVELSPNRILDTRNGIGAPQRKAERDEVLTLQVRGRGGVGADATSVVMNMTITNPEGQGFLTVWPCDRARPDASNLNFRAGDNVPNLVSVALSAAGTVCMSADARTDVLADVAGYLTAQPTTIPIPVLR